MARVYPNVRGKNLDGGGREMGKRGTAGSPSDTFREISTDSTTKEECKNKHQFSFHYHRQKMWFPCPGHSPIRLCRKKHGKRKQLKLIKACVFI